MTATLATVLERSEDRIFTVDVRRDGVALVTIDDPRATSNTVTLAFEAQLAATILRLDQDASIAAAVLVSGKPDGFLAGMNTELLRSIKFATDAERIAGVLAHTLGRLHHLRKPVVAAVHGPALGVGFEVALACHAIVASDDPRTALGLPQVLVGLVPSANGTLRLVDRAGLRVAIDVAVGGNVLTPGRARDLALVDDVCPRAILVDAAARHAKALVGHVPRVRDGRGDAMTLALEKNALGRRLVFRRTRERVRAEARGHYAAPGLAVDVLERFAARGFAAAALLEAKVFGELVVSETAHRLVELASATVALERDAGSGSGVPGERIDARRVERIAVLGGGDVGAGIAYVTVAAGIPVRLKERDDAGAGRALRSVKQRLDARVNAGELGALASEQIFARLSAMTDFSGVRNADLVVEAVADDLPAKQGAVRDLEALVDPRCVVASTTASLPIVRIAQSATHPERVLGMHYFEPVADTPLLEVVRAEKTAAWAVATAVALGKRQGKTVIVVGDGPGFYTTRILAPYLNESAHLVGDGVAVDAVDAAMVDWGFAVGPLRRLDAIGIDVALQVAQSLQAWLGARMTPPGTLSAMVADDRRGRSNARGFYRGEGRRGGVDPGVYRLLGAGSRAKLPAEEIQMRCALAMVNEAVRCLGEGILREPRDGDVGAVFGLGFPRFRGGPFRYVDTIGAADVLRRLQGYADRFGERWRPAPLLVQMAKKGERFYV